MLDGLRVYPVTRGLFDVVVNPVGMGYVYGEIQSVFQLYIVHYDTNSTL